MKVGMIEVVFAGGRVSPETVTEHSFLVRDATDAVIPGLVQPVAETIDTFRWIAKGGAPSDTYALTLVGSPDEKIAAALEGLTAIASYGGIPLDGEPNKLPSGNGQPGGDFVLLIKTQP
jgi:hypothetical protein